jgi:FdhD protein
MGSSSLAVDIERIAPGARLAEPDRVAIEEPLEIRLGYAIPEGRTVKSLSLTMRTPGNDAELAAGFLVSECIVKRSADIVSIEACGQPMPGTARRNVIRVDLADHVRFDPARLSRHFYTTSSCGVCGKASLDALRALDVAPPPVGTPTFGEPILVGMPDRLRAAQATFEETGGLHAASAFTADGEIIVTREDVGRHNAVDKVVGQLLRDNRLPANDLGLMVSGRASFELVQKGLTAGMPLIAAVSAPSSLAIELAREFDMTLIGFLRGSTFNIYSAPERLAS